MTPVYLQELIDEVNAVNENELKDPGDAAGEGEEVIGEMSLFLKKLYTLRDITCREGTRIQQLNGIKETPDNKALESKLLIKHSLLDELFWWCVVNETQCYGKDMGVRTGFIITARPAREIPFGFPGLGGLPFPFPPGLGGLPGMPPPGGWGKMQKPPTEGEQPPTNPDEPPF